MSSQHWVWDSLSPKGHRGHTWWGTEQIIYGDVIWLTQSQKLPTHPILCASQLGSRRPFPLRVQSKVPSNRIVFLQSSVCEKIMELLGQNKIDHHQRQVVILSQDSFYKVLTPEQKAKAGKGQFNFDHPGMCTRLERLYGRCVYYNRAISAACFLIASLRLFSVLALAHPLFGAWVPLLTILNQIIFLDY